MLKRFVTIAAIAALPLASGCGGQGSGPEPASGGPEKAASPVATEDRPAEPPAGEKGASPDATEGGPAQPAAGAAAPKDVETRNPVSRLSDRAPEFREVTIPAGTILPVRLETGVGSASSRPEDPVRATLRTPITIQGYEVLPAGTAISGVVTDARRSGRVKGRAHVAIRFNSLQARDERLSIRTSTIARTAPATKKSDATKIGIGAGAGALVGGIVGGGSGAAKGAAIGGAGGTGVVLATRGKEVSFPSGARLRVTLLEPITLMVPLRD